MASYAQTLLLTDDHVIVRKGIIASLQNDNTRFKILEASSFCGMKQMLEWKTVSHLILDLKMDNCSLLEPFNFVRRNYPDIFVMILTATPFVVVGDTLLKAGVSGYLSKQSTADGMTYGINHFLTHGTYLPPNIKRTKEQDDQYNPFSSLSERELVVAGYLLEGMMIKQIAQTLNLSTTAVSTYKARVLNKLKVDSLIGIGQMATAYSFPV
jgi:DNA-binding NarL/FixJ family response regulator